MALSLPISSAGADDFYKGNTAKIVVGYSAGGGYDRYVRTFAPHFAKHIPGKPNVIVQNMPGAASLKSIRYLDAGAPTDGTVVASFDPGLVTDSLTVPEKVPERFTNFHWIGAMARDLRVCYALSSNKVTTWDQIMKSPGYTMGATGRGSSAYKNAIVLTNMLKAPMKIITGYPGSNEQRLAMERGELDSICGNFSSVPEDWINEKRMAAFVKFSRAKAAGLPDDVPFIGDLTKSEEDKKIIRLLFESGEVGRPFAASKKVPVARIKTLQTAFDATMKDAAFLADMKKQRLVVDPVSGPEAAKIVEGIYDVSPDLVAKAKKLVE
jgi:tripartite-type tricarboxylate transporter receptor subunit TctC